MDEHLTTNEERVSVHSHLPYVGLLLGADRVDFKIPMLRILTNDHAWIDNLGRFNEKDT
jgi:hypothetical protein